MIEKERELRKEKFFKSFHTKPAIIEHFKNAE